MTGWTSASYILTGLTNRTSYVFKIDAVSSVGSQAWIANSGSVTPSASTPAATCNGDCYSDTNALATGVAVGPGGVNMQYVDSGAGTGCRIWLELGGTLEFSMLRALLLTAGNRL